MSEKDVKSARRMTTMTLFLSASPFLLKVFPKVALGTAVGLIGSGIASGTCYYLARKARQDQDGTTDFEKWFRRSVTLSLVFGALNIGALCCLLIVAEDKVKQEQAKVTEADNAVKTKNSEIELLKTKVGDLVQALEVIAKRLWTESWVIVENDSTQTAHITGENSMGRLAGSTAPPTDTKLDPTRVIVVSAGKASYGVAAGVVVSCDGVTLPETQSHGKYLCVSEIKTPQPSKSSGWWPWK